MTKQRHGVGGYRAKPSGDNPHDFYPTPAGVVQAFLDACPLPHDGVWCEPAVGDGVIVRTVGPREHWYAFDVRPECETELADVKQWSLDYHTLDFLSLPDGKHFDVVITNPPFYLAEQFVRKALACSTHVVMLLRLAFLESRKRERFHKEHPSDVYVLSRRPSFQRNGATDNSAYAWFHWGPDCGGRWRILVTPETNKKASAA